MIPRLTWKKQLANSKNNNYIFAENKRGVMGKSVNVPAVHKLRLLHDVLKTYISSNRGVANYLDIVKYLEEFDFYILSREKEGSMAKARREKKKARTIL